MTMLPATNALNDHEKRLVHVVAGLDVRDANRWRDAALLSALALALSSGFVHAQTTTGETSTLDTVQVTGVRSSLQKSQIIKQDFIGTVDAVSAEDVGKFPDQNVADALQRVPGVSVDRSGGESRFITVRGFGPEFNTVLLNGRIMATESAGREFSFDILPSELISAAEVQKTSSASSSEGSIGAMINIRTQRPLDNPGLQVSGTVAGIYDDTTDTSKPKISGLISNTNADGTLGGLLSFVRYQRHHTREYAGTGGWLTGDAGHNGIAVPRELRYEVTDEQRTRTGINGALDWRPKETITLRVDAMYSKYKIDTAVNGLGFYTDPGDSIQEITADANGTAITFRRADSFTDHIMWGGLRDSTNQQFGANLVWQLSNQTALDIDGSWSKAENDGAGKSYFQVIGRVNDGVNPVWNLNPGAFPTYDGLPPLTATSDLRSHIAVREGDTVSDELGEFKTSLTRSFYEGMLSQLQFGVSASTRTKESKAILTPGELNCAYCGYLVAVPADLTQIFNAGNVAGSGSPTQWLRYDPEEYFTYLGSVAAYSQAEPGGPFYNPDDPDRAQIIAEVLSRYGGGFNAVNWPLGGWKVREKNYAVYAQADFEGDLRTMPWKLNVGVRYIRTGITSDAVSAQVEAITSNPGDTNNAQVSFTPPLPLSKRSHYHNWLPSLNFRLNLRDDLVLRASASKTLTRPTLTNLRANESIGVRPPGPGSYNTGNVDLKPYVSKNFDLGLEWYLNDTSYIAVAGFYKNVDNFIAQITIPTTILDYPFLQTMPVNADSAVVKGAEFSFQYTFDRLPAPFDGLGMQLNYTAVDSQQSFDPSIATGQFAVVGLSDSGNLVFFYEKGRFGFRAAYNWRDEYLSAVRGEQGEPTTVDAYDQLDLSANIKLNERVSVFLEATNLTSEKESAWSRYKNRVQWWMDNGRTLTLGMRGAW